MKVTHECHRNDLLTSFLLVGKFYIIGVQDLSPVWCLVFVYWRSKFRIIVTIEKKIVGDEYGIIAEVAKEERYGAI